MRSRRHAGAGELAVDVAAHRLGDLLDAVGLGHRAPGAQPLGLAEQRLQRRLQPVGEVGGAGAGAAGLGLPRLDQRVDLGGERPHLVGEVVAEPRRAAPERTAATRAPTAASGRSPTATCTQAAGISASASTAR